MSLLFHEQAPGTIPEFMQGDHSEWALTTPERPTMRLEGWALEPCEISLTSGEGRGLGD